jgi:hypothetical protein
MKGETVAPETSWLGIPTAEAARPAAMPPVAEAVVAAGAAPEVARDVAWLEQSL